MASSGHSAVSGEHAKRETVSQWRPPPMPVVLRIPRIVLEPGILEETPPQAETKARRPEFRWPISVGVGLLMLIAAVPWLLRRHSPPEASLEALAPAVVIEDDANVEILPPLYADSRSSQESHARLSDGKNDTCEVLDALVVPKMSGGTQ
jgi:hypothetical protein